MDHPYSHSEIPKNPLRFLLYVSRPHTWFAVGALCAATVAEVFSSSTSYVLKTLVDSALQGEDRLAQAHALLIWGSIYVAVIGVMFLFWRLSGFIGMQWVSRSQATAYTKLTEYISLHSHTYFSDRFSGALSNKISHAADGVERFLENFLWGYYTGALGLIITIGILFSVYPLVGYLYLGLIVFIVALNIVLVKIQDPYVRAHAEASSTFRGANVDFLSNIMSVRQYTNREYELDRLRSNLADWREKGIRQWRLSEWSLLTNNVLIVAVLGGIVYLTAQKFIQGVTTAGDVVLVISLVFQTSYVLTFIGSSINTALRVYGDIAEGLTEILVSHEIVDDKSARNLVVLRGEIIFDNVTFAYKEQKIFDSLSLKISPGERVGLVGTSGAGKTTLTSLLLRQHDIQGGSISIDGYDISEVTQDSLRDAISLVPQDPQLFHRTIRENISYGKLDATLKEVEDAARMAYAHDFISTTASGYDTLVGERGVKLSGGQKQRVIIARAILKNAPILVLDEATSALDSGSEAVIQKALHILMEGKTVIAIAHRLSTLREMDRIIVLDNGKVAETGTHDELKSKKGGIYANLWEHQVNGFIQE